VTHWQAGRFEIDLAEPRVMGIVNLTPDSFTDGDPALTPARALATCERLLAEGADILDLGGESSRPGADPVDLETELARVLPVLREAVRFGCPVSVDTAKPEVMRAALDLGADIVNDIGALRAPGRARGGGGASRLRRLPDAHARHAALDAEPRPTTPTSSARSAPSSASVSPRSRRPAWRASASSSIRASASARPRRRTWSCCRARKSCSRSACPSSSAGRASRPWRASPGSGRTPPADRSAAQRDGARQPPASPPRCSRCSAGRGSCASTTSRRWSRPWRSGRPRPEARG
jgi:hypothetical protein